jgi:hypothetical protein
MKRSFTTFVLALAAFSQLGSTDCGQVVRDPGFDLWCGAGLCAWKIERGDIAKVPTWNKGDPGVELVGDDVAIEQLSPVTSSDGACLEFDLIANVDELAQVDLNVDVFGDGSVEHTEHIPTSNWKPLAFLLPIQGVYGGIRFELAKKGSGRAVLANIGAKIVKDCGGLDPIVPAPAPNGAVCASASGCRSGICGGGFLFEYVCVGCDGAAGQCSAGDVCGLGDPTSPVYGIPLECVPANARALGDNCLFGDECASGICNSGACSTCDASHACANGETCGAAWATPPPPPIYSYWHTPYVCSPDAMARKAGEPCASDADCASGSCAGTPRMQCDDGRSCATAADCPFGGSDTENGLENGPCNTVGVQGGTCQ